MLYVMPGVGKERSQIMDEISEFVFEIDGYDPACITQVSRALDAVLKRNRPKWFSSFLKVKEPSKKSCCMAAKLMDSKIQRLKAIGGSVAVQFYEKGFQIGNRELIPYSSLEQITETGNYYLLVYSDQFTVLQKKNMIKGDLFHFAPFLEEKVGVTVKHC